MPGRVPTTPQEAPIKTILRSKMFAHPGVVQLGPHHYRVSVVAQQFSFDPSKIVVPVNAKIDFYITSRDVVHGFLGLGTDVNAEIFPGYVSHVFATFHKPHKYLLACDQYCGIGHQHMTGEVDVVAKMPPPNASGSGKKTPGTASASLAQAGKSVFKSNCAACHQASGKGIPGSFPPLAGTVPAYAKSATRRKILPQILLYGMHGKIKAKGNSYDGHMPAWGDKLSNKQIAAVLYYVATAWSNKKAEPSQGYRI